MCCFICFLFQLGCKSIFFKFFITILIIHYFFHKFARRQLSLLFLQNFKNISHICNLNLVNLKKQKFTQLQYKFEKLSKSKRMDQFHEKIIKLKI